MRELRLKVNGVLLALLLAVVLAGCSNSTYEKSMEEAKLALAAEEFDKATSYYELALEEKPKDEEAKKVYEQLVSFQVIKEEAEQDNWIDVIKQSNDLLTDSSLPSSLKQEVETYLKNAQESINHKKTIANKIVEITKMINDERYEEAQNEIELLQQNKSMKTSLVAYQQDLNDLVSKLNTALNNQKEEAEKQVIQKRAEETAKKPAVSQQNTYLDRMNTLTDEQDYPKENLETTVSQMEYVYKWYGIWDDLLNEIYGDLQKQLSTSQMEKLRTNQRQWIKNRDRIAEQESSEFAGGTFEEVQYTYTLARETRDRCYELVNLYMN